MHLYNTHDGVVLDDDGDACLLAATAWDAFFTCDDARALVQRARSEKSRALRDPQWRARIRAPIGHQEVWAAGVTYFRSRDARMEESADAGGGDFYARVYEADRPELFLKATPHRVVGPGQAVRVRRDSKWNVPEPELTVAINTAGRIFAYTVGNDVSSRDIEGANPLYLPQAKVYDQCCALGPGLLLADEPLDDTTQIQMTVRRAAQPVMEGTTTLAQLKRKPAELAAYLFRENSFPNGSFLMTGTGIVPPGDFTLQSGDQVSIQIDGIGTLVNSVM